MLIQRLLQELKQAPLIASVQASAGSPVDDPATLLRLAQASLDEGVKMLRMQGLANIRAVRNAVTVPMIGLIKRDYEGSEVYITPTLHEVKQLIETGCEVIALDGTPRKRPKGETLKQLIEAIHAAGRLAMVDCDTCAHALEAARAGADLLSTTLSGYTPDSVPRTGPDLKMLRQLVSQTDLPVIAEGRFTEPWQMQAALRIGAKAVVIGGALNDPKKQTRAFLRAAPQYDGNLGAFDLGGTNLRFGLFDADLNLLDLQKTEMPELREKRIVWMRRRMHQFKLRRVGISSGGVIDPQTGVVIDSKPIIPHHLGTDFPHSLSPARVVALNDGLATAWGHACLPECAGLRVATLALGTGVGCGFVADGKIWMGPRGEYPRLNDLKCSGKSYEELLGGAALTATPDLTARRRAMKAARQAVETIDKLFYPDVIVICGGVGLAEWMDLRKLRAQAKVIRSPYGQHAGLYGAACLSLYPNL